MMSCKTLASTLLACLLLACGEASIGTLPLTDANPEVPVGPNEGDTPADAGDGNDPNMAPTPIDMPNSGAPAEDGNAGVTAPPASQPPTQEYPPLPVLAATTKLSAKLTLGASARVLNPNVASLSYEKRFVNNPLFDANNADMVAVLKLLGPGILRFGGNGVDQTPWDPNDSIATTAVRPADIQKLAAFCRATQWKVLYGLRMVGSTPTQAADEALSAATLLGSALYGFEVGNEPDYYFKNVKVADPNYNLQKFISGGGTLAGWTDFVASIRARVPQAVMTGPGAYNAPSGWAAGFAGKVGTQIHELTQHYYKGWGPDASSTGASLLVADANLPSFVSTLRTAAGGIGGRIRITEGNSFAGGGATGVSNAYPSALWAANALFVAGAGGIGGFHFHGGGNGAGYTPIANDSNGRVQEIRPLFYGMLAYRRAAQGKFLTTTFATASQNITIRATQASNNSVRALLLNTSMTATTSVTVQWPTNMTASKGTALLLANQTPGGTSAQLAATSNTTLGGSAIAPNGAWEPKQIYQVANVGGRTTVTIAPLSGMLLQME